MKGEKGEIVMEFKVKDLVINLEILCTNPSVPTGPMMMKLTEGFEELKKHKEELKKAVVPK